MTDNEIIKALECCSIPTLMSRKCEDCPMKVEGALCFSRLAHDTICLIERQQAEIDNYKTNIVPRLSKYNQRYKKLEEENRLLKVTITSLRMLLVDEGLLEDGGWRMKND